MAPTNPFTPTFGVTPPLLAGREEEIEVFRQALSDGPGSPGRALLFTGGRGSGKTVLLNAVESTAKANGWLVASSTARPGMANELTATILPGLLAEHDPDAVINTVTSANVSLLGVSGGVSRTHRNRHQPNPTVRSQLELLAQIQSNRGTGVVLSIDEIHRAALADIREIVQAVQHTFRAGLPVAFAAAGLPSAVESLLNDDVVTFLRRAERFELGPMTVSETSQALVEPIKQSGRAISTEALTAAVTAAAGYPFLVQVVGYQIWAAAP